MAAVKLKCLLCLLFLSTSDSLELSIVHINDFHARFEEVNTQSGICKEEGCIGGFSRVYSQITSILAASPNSVLLNGGDNFQGTLYYNLFKWNITQYFLNKLPFDAIVLGNHEFDDGIAGVVPFLEHLKAPVVVSNINDTLEPNIQNLYNKSVVVERDGQKIGIIGVITKLTDQISSSGKLSFFDESESVNAEAERLVQEEGVFTNIVLSHSGYDIEQEIARKATTASKIGVIVGGHSHSFLYTGPQLPGPDNPAGPYPTIVNRNDGQTVLVLQASAYTKYVGNITVSYDTNGNVLSWSGEPIYLDTSKLQDEDINQQLLPWKEDVDSVGTKIIGSSFVSLDRSNCYYSECLLGNFVTDAMVYAYTELAEDDSWTYASLAVTNPGGLRTTIANGDITYGDAATAQPFENTFDLGEIQGKYIKEFFEFGLQSPYSFGRAYVDITLLQVSGFHLVFNVTRPAGERAQSIKIRCQKCRVPVYEDLEVDKTYRLVVPSFLKTGGDGYTSIQENLKNIRVGRVDIDVIVEYLSKKSPVFQEIEGRITIVGAEGLTTRNMD